MTNEQLGDFVFAEFGLDKSEIEIKENQVEGNPSSLTLTWCITGLRLAVYDIKVVNNKSDKALIIRIRFYKLFIFPLLFPLMTLLLNDLIMPGLIAYVFSVFFFGMIALFELYTDKSKIESKIKKLAITK